MSFLRTPSVPLSKPMPQKPVLGKVTGTPITDNTSGPTNISDVWADEVERDTEAVVHAYFNHWGHCADYPQATLVAVSVESDSRTTTYHSADWFTKLVGLETVCRLEQHESRRLNDE